MGIENSGNEASEELEDVEYEEEKKVEKVRRFKDVSVKRAGTQITLPEGMTYEQGIKWLDRKRQEDEREVQIAEQIDAFPLDGAYAIFRAMSRKYGFVGMVPTPGFFGSTPPTMIGVEAGPGQMVQVPWGSMQIPNIQGRLETGVAHKDGRQVFVLHGIVRQKHKKEVAELAAMAREIVRKESIYKGKAIRASFPELNPRDFNPMSHAPKFIDTAEVKENELIFSQDVRAQVASYLFTPIEKTALCREHNIPLKRGILLEGPYGTGKTQTAYVAAKKAVENGWTFIYLDTVDNLQRAIFFAQQYGPAVIFAEDIDSVMDGERTEDMNGILNTIDGVDTKGHEIIVVLTTNHVENINPAMLRPGRLDAVIQVRAPDAHAVQALLRLYSRGLIPADENLDEVGRVLKGHIPAVIREVVERSKLNTIMRLSKDEAFTLKQGDLLVAAESILAQVELINPKKLEPRNIFKEMGTAAGSEMAKGLLVAAILKGEHPGVLAVPPSVLEEMKEMVAELPVPHNTGNGSNHKSS